MKPGSHTAQEITVLTTRAAALLRNAHALLRRAADQADHLYDNEFAATDRAIGMQLIRDDNNWLYQGLHGYLSTRRLRVWKHITTDNLTAVITEHSNNTGTSITNAAESVAAQLASEYPGREIRIIEHYLDSPFELEHYDEVTVNNSGKTCWRELDPLDLLTELGPEFLA